MWWWSRYAFIIIWLFLMLFNILISKIIYTDVKRKNVIITSEKRPVNNPETFFDGLPILYEPSPFVTNNNDNNKERVNCNSVIVVCEGDEYCRSRCNPLSLTDIKSTPVCSIKNGNICAYEFHHTRTEKVVAGAPVCFNGGEPLPFVGFGKLFECACPSGFIGRYCEIQNLLAPAAQKTFPVGDHPPHTFTRR